MTQTRILVVGQTPPPLGGQAIMISKILAAQYKQLRLIHVRLSFSDSFIEVGRVNIFKIFHLVKVVFQILLKCFVNRASVLYYPPSGPDRIPVYRDIAILLMTRWAFRNTIFHFHAGGLSEIFPRMGKLAQYGFMKAYGNPDLTIRLSELNPDDGGLLGTKRDVIIPYGIRDVPAHLRVEREAKPGVPVEILYVGVVRESKGVVVLVEAAGILRRKGYDITLNIMGEFATKSFERLLLDTIHSLELDDHIKFLGVLDGPEKHRAYSRSDVFCFPSYFESESFGLVLLEAMQHGLPVVSTLWRGIPSIIKDGYNGILVPVRDSLRLSLALEKLVCHPELRESYGRNGRTRYLNNYRDDLFERDLEKALLSVVQG